MKHSFKLVVLTMLTFVGINFASCGSSSDDEPTTLTVNPNAISLVSSANASATITIECSGQWLVTSYPDWINISSTSGTGNTTLTITALTENATASVRSGYIMISSDDLEATVNVSQVAALKSGCEVTIDDQVILNTSATFRLKFGSNASYMYGGFLSASAAGWNDNKIVEVLENSAEAMNCKNGMTLTADNLNEKTSYIQCFVAYDAKGNRGEVIRIPFTTASSKNAPAAYISDVSYSDDYWYWSTSISATASEYYMVAYTGDLALLMAALEPSDLAMMIKDSVNDLVSYVNGTNWRRERNSGEMDILITTWAKRDNVWSGYLDIFWGHLTDNISSTSGVKIEANNLDADKYANSHGKMVAHYPNEIENVKKHLDIQHFSISK